MKIRQKIDTSWQQMCVFFIYLFFCFERVITFSGLTSLCAVKPNINNFVVRSCKKKTGNTVNVEMKILPQIMEVCTEQT